MRERIARSLTPVAGLMLSMLLILGCGGGGGGGGQAPAVSSGGTLRLRLPVPSGAQADRRAAKIPADTDAYMVYIIGVTDTTMMTVEIEIPDEPEYDFVDAAIPDIRPGAKYVLIYAADELGVPLAAGMEPVLIQEGEYAELVVELGMVVFGDELMPERLELDLGEAVRIKNADDGFVVVTIEGYLEPAHFILGRGGLLRYAPEAPGNYLVYVNGEPAGEIEVADAEPEFDLQLTMEVLRTDGVVPLGVETYGEAVDFGDRQQANWTFGGGGSFAGDYGFNVYNTPGIFTAYYEQEGQAHGFNILARPAVGNVIEGLYHGLTVEHDLNSYSVGFGIYDAVAGEESPYINVYISSEDSDFQAYAGFTTLMQMDGMLFMAEDPDVIGGYSADHKLFGMVRLDVEAPRLSVFGRPLYGATLADMAGTWRSVSFAPRLEAAEICLEDTVVSGSSATTTGECIWPGGSDTMNETETVAVYPSGLVTTSEEDDVDCFLLAGGQVLGCSYLDNAEFPEISLAVKKGSSYSQAMLTGQFNIISTGRGMSYHEACAMTCELVDGEGYCGVGCSASDYTDVEFNEIEVAFTVDSDGTVTESRALPGVTCYLSADGGVFVCGHAETVENDYYFFVGIKSAGDAATRAPAVYEVTPDAIYSDEGATLSIYGAYFQSGATVTVGTTACTGVTVVSPETITCTVPAGIAPGAYAVTVTNPDAQGGTLPNALTISDESMDHEFGALSGTYYLGAIAMNGPEDKAWFGTAAFSEQDVVVEYYDGPAAEMITEVLSYGYMVEERFIFLGDDGMAMRSMSRQLQVEEAGFGFGFVSEDERLITMIVEKVDGAMNMVLIKKGDDYTGVLPAQGDVFYCTGTQYWGGTPETSFVEIEMVGGGLMDMNIYEGNPGEGNIVYDQTGVPFFPIGADGSFSDGYAHAAVMEGGEVLFGVTRAQSDSQAQSGMNVCIKRDDTYPSLIDDAYWGISLGADEYGGEHGFIIIDIDGEDVLVQTFWMSGEGEPEMQEFTGVTLSADGRLEPETGVYAALGGGGKYMVVSSVGAETLSTSILHRAPIGLEIPEATILAPAEGSSFELGETITFTGEGFDANEGYLSGDSLTWSSSIDGLIGYGETLQISTLSEGMHVITLMAENSMRGFDLDSIMITVGDVSFGALSGTYHYGEIYYYGGGRGASFGSITFDEEHMNAEWLTGDGEVPTTYSMPYMYDASNRLMRSLDDPTMMGVVSEDESIILLSSGPSEAQYMSVLLRQDASYEGFTVPDGTEYFCGMIGEDAAGPWSGFTTASFSGGGMYVEGVSATLTDSDIPISEGPYTLPSIDDNGVMQVSPHEWVGVMEGGAGLLKVQTYGDSGEDYYLEVCLRKASTPYTDANGLDGLLLDAVFAMDEAGIHAAFGNNLVSPEGIRFVAIGSSPWGPDYSFGVGPAVTLEEDGFLVGDDPGFSAGVMEGYAAVVNASHTAGELFFSIMLPAADGLMPPTVTITSPADGATIPAGEPVWFVGDAVASGGAVSTGEGAVWFDGELPLGDPDSGAFGLEVEAALLEMGEHEITLVVPDSNGLFGFDTITVYVAGD